MQRKTKICLIAAALLVVAGVALFSAVMQTNGWDFTKLSTGKFQLNTYEISQEFRSVSIRTDTADIAFVLSPDGKCKVECYEDVNAKHSVTVNENTLSVQLVDHRQWYDYIGIHLNTPRVIVYLPVSEYTELFVQGSTGDVQIPRDFTCNNIDISTNTGDIEVSASTTGPMILKTRTGDITLKNMSAGTMKLTILMGLITVNGAVCHGDISIHVSTGETDLTNVVCKKIVSKGDTGDIVLNQVVAEEIISIERSTGDVRFHGSDALGIFVETDTGDVTGSLLTGKYFMVETDTGSVDVPKDSHGGRCGITTGTGDVQITIS